MKIKTGIQMHFTVYASVDTNGNIYWECDPDAYYPDGPIWDDNKQQWREVDVADELDTYALLGGILTDYLDNLTTKKAQ